MNDTPKPSLFHALYFGVAPVDRDAFVADAARRFTPVGASMKIDGILASRIVYEHQQDIDQDSLPGWQFLQLTRLAPGIGPDEFLNAEKQTEVDSGGRHPSIKVWRSEFLHTVPTADLPALKDGQGSERANMFYKIEYIDVFPEHADSYSKIISTYDGPAKVRMIEKGFMYDFVALETSDVIYSDPSLPTWNVMHVMGLDDPEKYKQLPSEFDLALRAMNPEWSHKGLYGRLPEMRIKRRHFIGRMLPELSIV